MCQNILDMIEIFDFFKVAKKMISCDMQVNTKRKQNLQKFNLSIVREYNI